MPVYSNNEPLDLQNMYGRVPRLLLDEVDKKLGKYLSRNQLINLLLRFFIDDEVEMRIDKNEVVFHITDDDGKHANVHLEE